ncbi:hypothetical protein ACFL43_07175 [Thermodesulfobacteriota bacterium]
MRWKHQFFYIVHSLLLLVLAVYVGIDSSLHFVVVFSENEAAVMKAIDQLPVHLSSDRYKNTASSKRPELQHATSTVEQSAGAQSKPTPPEMIIQCLKRIAPIWVVFVLVYFVLNRLIKRVSFRD